MSVAAVIEELDRLVADLEQPPTGTDAREGWSDNATRLYWRKHFSELADRLRRGDAPDGDQYHLMRWLNADGVGAGPLAARARAIQTQLWEHYATSDDRASRRDTFSGREARRLLRELGIRR